MKTKTWVTRLVLVAIVALALGLRVWGINFGLPYTVAPDEPTHLSIALRIFKTGDLNPHWLNYPSLMFYLNALAYVPFYLAGKLLGMLSSPADIPYPEIVTIGVGRSLMPSQFLLGRAVTALFGAASVALVYLLGRELHSNRIVAILAALLLAVSPTNASNSHLIRPDTFVVFFVLFSVLWTRRILDNPSRWNYAWAGIGAGLAVSCKYNVPLIIAPLIVAHFQTLRRLRTFAGLGFGLALSVLAFFLTTPFAVLDYQQFVRDWGFEVSKQIAGGHAGFEGDALAWYLTFLWETEGVVFILAVLEAARLVWTRSKRGSVLLAFPLTYFILISLLTVRNDRTILPILPFVYLLAAMFLARLHEWLVNRQRVPLLALKIGFAMVCALWLLLPLQQTLAADAALLRTDSRETARIWIEQNLPAGARIALEAYSPYVSRERFVVEGLEGIIAHPPEWYVQNGFEYLVFSYGAYGRFYENAARYAEFAERYNAFFARFPEVRRFNDGGFEIRIHKTNVTTLPAQRVAARWGVHGEWLELVGYDLNAPQSLTFYWRALQSRREPLKLTVRLLDRADREIAQSSDNLFGAANPGGHWPEGVTRVPWTIAVPANAAPGVYRLELDVDAEGWGRVPVLSFDRQPISDKLFIAPFKIPPAPPSAEEWQRAQRVNAQFAKQVTLLAYSLKNDTARPGDSLPVTLYWQSAAQSDKDYTFFLHLLDSNGSVRAQIDAQPRDGAYPTSFWDVGEIVRDDYAIALPRDLAPGEYKIEIGWYEYPSLARLPATDADGKSLGDHLILSDAIRVTR